MSQTQTLTEWRERLLSKLMAALDAAWETIDANDDPAAVRKARDRAKACAELAAAARKVAALALPSAAPRPATGLAGLVEAAQAAQSAPARKLDQLKGGGRGRL